MKSLKTWLDSVSIGESTKNVGGCKNPSNNPIKQVEGRDVGNVGVPILFSNNSNEF